MKTNSVKVKELQQFADEKFAEYNLEGWALLLLTKDDIRWLGLPTRYNGLTIFPINRIIISKEVVKEFKVHTLKDIFLHELAHAISKENHTKRFREIAKQIGCQGLKAKPNRYIFDMYGTFKVTPQQEIICMQRWYDSQE